MAKEGVKAREVKRQKLVAKYADKRAELKAAGDFEGLDKLPKNSSEFVYTTVVKLLDVLVVTCVLSVYQGYCSVIWL